MYTITPETANTLSQETNIWKWPQWATYLILTAGPLGITWFIIHQSKSKRARDRKLIEILKDTNGKITEQSMIDDEAGKDVYIQKGQKKFMTLDSDKLQDIDPDDFKE